MDTQETILYAYHRAIARHLEKTGESYPLVRTSCVDEDEGVIYSTGSNMEKVATFTLDSLDRPRIRLV